MSTEGFSESLRPVPVEMELRFGTHKERVRGILVGQRKQEYLIVEVSKKHNWAEIQEWFSSAATVVIRGVLDQGKVVAGATGFITAIARPQRMVFLNYPQRFESRILRHTPRVEVELDAIVRPAPNLPSPFTVESGLTEIKGNVIDISRGGMGFKSVAQLEISADELNGSVVEIEIFDGEKQLLKTLAEIRGSKLSEEYTVMGLLVDRHDEQYTASLDNLILHSKLIKEAIKG